MKQISIKRNLMYNFSYQVLVIIVPLLTSPYISRVLGAENIGLNSWTYSIVFYFMIFSMLGISNYGNRSIAAVRDSLDDRNRVFCEIYLWQIIMGCTMLLLYVLYLLFVVKDNLLIFTLQGFFILSSIFDVTWYFYGMEDFRSTVIRNVFIKIFSLISIFLFVKSANDLWKYTIINAGGTFLGQLLIWPILLKDIKFVWPSFDNMKIHFKPIIILFIPVLAISVFTYMDKYMIGKFSTLVESGYYENTDKIIGIPKAIITALGTVMLPRTAYLIAHNEENKSDYYIELTMFVTMVLSSAFMFGMSSVSDVFSIIFWGEDFKQCGVLISLISPAIFFSVFGNVIRTQYLIPRKKDKEYTISLIIGAITNFLLNYRLVGDYGALGAVIGTVVAELVMTLIQSYFVRRNLNLKCFFQNGLIFFVFGFVMYVVVTILKLYLKTNLLSLIFLILIGAIVYSLLCYLYIIYSKKEFVIDVKNLFLKSIVHKKS